MANPKFIVMEGIDGAGKTTQLSLLEKALKADGIPVFRTAEPSESTFGKQLREALAGKISLSPAELAALFTLDRISHNKIIEEHLKKGETVLCDRYFYSTLAYQGEDTDPNWVYHMNLDCPNIRTPDLCIFLDLSPKESVKRISLRGEKAEIYESEQTLEAVRNRFRKALKSFSNVLVVDAAASPEEVHQRILAGL